MAELEKAGMVWSSKVKPNQVLVHPQNRSGQMCNPHDVLQKGLAISEVGWELAKVRSPVGVQIGSGAQRDAIFDANQRLHDQSGGIMAKPSGQENIASISASHTTAFLRCVENGCKLPDDTSIEQLLHQGDDLQTMISDGWLWTVVSAKVEEEVPAVLSVLQQAYNCDHSIAKAPNELEVALSIATFYRMQPEGQKDLKKAVAQAAASVPPCKAYIKSVGDFVANFAGGESFELLKYLDYIGKHFGGTTHFGEEFTNLLAHCDWKEPSTTFPFIRVALACCQITAPKHAIKDGFSRLVVKADWDKLKNKKMVPEVLKAEAIMHAGWNMATQAQLPMEKMALPFGKLQMRLALHLLQKKGREMVQYKDMAEIKEKFAKDIVNVTTNPEQSSQAAASSDDKSSVKALAEATDAKAIALQAHKHIKLGGHYTFKNETKIWLLTDVTDERVKLVHRPFFEPEERKEVLHKDLKILKEWTKQVPHLVGDAVRSKMLPCASPSMQEELAKARAQVALYEKFQEHLNCITVLWQRIGDVDVLVSNQNQIFAGSKINKGKLLLLPMGSLQVASADQVSKTQCIITSNDLVGQVYVVQPWRCDFQKESGLFIPYWMVKEAAKPEDACLQKHSVKLGPLHIPAYTNKKQIDKGVALLCEPSEDGTKKRKVK
ncbi:unnamed protein product [Cladocopium goreaui]|uniref:Uncharacterized protein n=1 Tax=Cladocopium goreaui TaxID=2562237 RepID=A0A9P1CZ49_9DINO|nr:unnamed protein product [Cladocopium goreaui]